MAASTAPHPSRVDVYGTERICQRDTGWVVRLRDRWPWFAHLVRAIHRYRYHGGFQFGAAIAYFSVLSLIPLLMLVFSAAGFVLSQQPSFLHTIDEQIQSYIGGNVGRQITDILSLAIAQRGMVLGLGAFTALWTGTNWMLNLRFAASAMWRADALTENFVLSRFRDAVRLTGLVLILLVSFSVTSIRTTSFIARALELLGITEAPGVEYLFSAAALAVAVLANFISLAWMMATAPAIHVPWTTLWKPAVVGAVLLEVVKHLARDIAVVVLGTPAGAVFGPVIVIMVLLLVFWQVLLLCVAWSATSKRALALVDVGVPAAAHIVIREESASPSKRGGLIAIAVGAVLGWESVRCLHRSLKR